MYYIGLCIPGLRRLLHQPAIGLRRVPGGGPRGPEKGGGQTGARHTREGKGQRSRCYSVLFSNPPAETLPVAVRRPNRLRLP